MENLLMHSLVGSGNKPALDFREAVELCQHVCSTDEERHRKITPLPGFVAPYVLCIRHRGQEGSLLSLGGSESLRRYSAACISRQELVFGQHATRGRLLG